MKEIFELFNAAEIFSSIGLNLSENRFNTFEELTFWATFDVPAIS